jgi:hypothetical protein
MYSPAGGPFFQSGISRPFTARGLNTPPIGDDSSNWTINSLTLSYAPMSISACHIERSVDLLPRFFLGPSELLHRDLGLPQILWEQVKVLPGLILHHKDGNTKPARRRF